MNLKGIRNPYEMTPFQYKYRKDVVLTKTKTKGRGVNWLVS